MNTDASIDYIALERELQEKIEADKKYWLENNAKFRAINQRVASYDEFKEIVKAAHLKPLDKNEKVQNISGKYSIWNSLASRGEYHEKLSLQEVFLPGDSLPVTSGDFVKLWKNLNNEDKFLLLKRYEKTHLQKLFLIDIPSSVFSDSFQVLSSFNNNHTDVASVMKVLEEFTSSKRFNLCLQFLSSTERKECTTLFNKLEKFFTNYPNSFIHIGFSEQDFINLRNKYLISE